MIVWSKVSLVSGQVEDGKDWRSTYFDDGYDVGRGVGEFGEIDIEMGQLILLGLVVNESRSFSNGMDAP